MANGKIHSKQLDGLVSIENGGTNNDLFTASQIIIASTASLVSSGYKFDNFGTSSNDIWGASKVISYINDITVGTKAGSVDGSLFTGIDKIYDVLFDVPFGSDTYSVNITGNSARSWTISNKSSSGFRINSNSTSLIIGDVYWICVAEGESSAVPNTNKGQIGLGINGNGLVITPGVKSYLTIPYSGYITGWELLSTATGSIVIDVWKDTYLNYPPTLSDSICGIDKPTLSSQMKNNNNLLTEWLIDVTEGDIMAFKVDSNDSLKQVTLTLKINKI